MNHSALNECMGEVNGVCSFVWCKNPNQSTTKIQKATELRGLS